MATNSRDITFVIGGEIRPLGATRAKSLGTVKASVRVGAQRGGGEAVRITARPGEDVVVLTIANGPTLVLHPENARDLLRAQSSATRSAVKARDANEVEVSSQLGWPGLEATGTRGATRGWLGNALLSVFEVVTGVFKDHAVDLAAAAITHKLDGAVDEGIYELRADALPASLKKDGSKQQNVKPAADGGPLLVLIHGTFVDTPSTFGKLWTLHPQTVRELFKHYNDRVYALDHPTMGESPITNALALVGAMPAGARLHLVTHSRGGLVAEVLARACGGSVLTAPELAFFKAAGYEQHRSDLQKLVQMAQKKGLKVERVVRVACPARGTLLASKRLDAYLSILQWSLELAGVPVMPQFVDFLHQVALRRSDPAELPGIAAMMPESPVVNWLNSIEQPLPSELRVVAGDLQGDSIGAWVKTLLADAFYWTDNDLVVQTRSMYGGCPRATSAANTSATFVLDRGAKVTHFNYFANDSSVKAITSALVEQVPADFASIGPLSWAGKDAGGTRAATAVARSRGGAGANRADRPAVFVLPGILGSNLKLDDQRIWLGFRFVNSLMKLAWNPATTARITPDGPIGLTYDDLIERLADTHEVIPFAYDWRRPMEDEARRLAEAVDQELAVRSTSQQPVRLLAHSMGGLVARTMQLEKPATWQRMMARHGARVLMLGTPNGGSWAPMQTLSGDDTFGNALVAFGSLFNNSGARKMMAGMPGFIQLQAGLLDPKLGLDQAATWKKLADDDIAALNQRSIWHFLESQRLIYEWGAPPQAVLDQAVALRRRLDKQLETLGAEAEKVLLVIGHASFTPAGFVMSANGLEYENTLDDGDGRVTLASALLPGVRTWKVNAAHGKLPDESSAFAAYLELLSTGKTQLLPVYEPVARGARAAGATSSERAAAPAALVRSRPSRGLLRTQPPSSAADVLGIGSDEQVQRGGAAKFNIAVLNADLQFVREPLLIGHYRSLTLTGAEHVVDNLVNQGMSRALGTGLYPEEIGTHQIFGNHSKNPNNPLEMARPIAAVVAGLGEEGKLRVTELTYTVRQAVLAYAQRLSEQESSAPAHFDMAATLIGSGGAGITAGSAACAIAQGALEANLKLRDTGWPQLGRLTLVELYLERAGEAWRALKQQAIATPNHLNVEGKVQLGRGAMPPQPDSNYRGVAYDFISALPATESNLPNPSIAYALNTKRARTEVREQRAQGTLLRQLIATASNAANTDPLIGRTLFNLLVPVEMEPLLSGSSQIVLELAPSTAGIPWELLDTNPDSQATDQRPWAIRSKLIRKLRLKEFRPKVMDASFDDRVLVIGEPKCDSEMYPPLEGARREAEAVAARLKTGIGSISSDKVKLLAEHNDAQTIINALFEWPYRAVHIAGHGEPGEDGGVVLSGETTYLGANEVSAMRTVPELVFLNCCHLAGRDAAQILKPYDRAKFAANIAEALIRVGVRCVIAAGWAVEDDAAEKFATSFYAALLGGARFIDAVGSAREAAWKVNPQGNTWAAYQCYGDPEWTWHSRGGDAQTPTPPGDEFSGVASPVSLISTLQTLAIKHEFARDTRERDLDELLDRLRFLENEFKPLWAGIGAVAEAFGAAYAAANSVDKAIEWYQAALAAEDGSASFRAAEQLANQQIRRAEKQHDVKAIGDGITRLEALLAVQPTMERQSLLGSAYKRLTMVEWRARRRGPARVALEAMIQHYGKAEAMALKSGAAEMFYPAKNCLSAEVRAAFLKKRLPALAPERMKAVSDSLNKAATENPDFWSVVGQTELLILAALGKGQLANAEPALTAALRALKARVPARWMWDSAYNEAQFTLEPYLAMARGNEKRAAERLLDALKEMVAA